MSLLQGEARGNARGSGFNGLDWRRLHVGHDNLHQAKRPN